MNMYQQLKWVKLVIIIVNNADSWKSTCQKTKVFGIVQFLWNESDSFATGQPRDFPYLPEAAAVMADTGTFSNLHREVDYLMQGGRFATGQKMVLILLQMANTA
jgi:hypothetical protein